MAWQQLVTSGSDAELNSLTVNSLIIEDGGSFTNPNGNASIGTDIEVDSIGPIGLYDSTKTLTTLDNVPSGYRGIVTKPSANNSVSYINGLISTSASPDVLHRNWNWMSSGASPSSWTGPNYGIASNNGTLDTANQSSTAGYIYAETSDTTSANIGSSTHSTFRTKLLTIDDFESETLIFYVYAYGSATGTFRIYSSDDHTDIASAIELDYVYYNGTSTVSGPITGQLQSASNMAWYRVSVDLESIKSSSKYLYFEYIPAVVSSNSHRGDFAIDNLIIVSADPDTSNSVTINLLPNNINIDGFAQITKNTRHTTGKIITGNSSLDLYNSATTDIIDQGAILTFSNNFNGGSTNKALSAGIKGGKFTTENDARGFLAFYTANQWASQALSERMRIDYQGNVGIGTTTPDSDLHIYQSSNSGSGGGLQITGLNNTLSWRMYADPDLNLRFTFGGSTSLGGYISWAADVAAIDFTGQHRSIPSSGTINDYTSSVGYIVISDGTYTNFSGSNTLKPNINESLPNVSLSTAQNDKRVFGVISNFEDHGNTRTYGQGAFVTSIEKHESDTRLIINSLGEGAIWVSNYSGSLENGDYITSSPLTGLGMRQSDDLLHNYTVAKITQDCSFRINSTKYDCVEFELSGSTYRKAFVGCTYHCG